VLNSSKPIIYRNQIVHVFGCEGVSVCTQEENRKFFNKEESEISSSTPIKSIGIKRRFTNNIVEVKPQSKTVREYRGLSRIKDLNLTLNNINFDIDFKEIKELAKLSFNSFILKVRTDKKIQLKLAIYMLTIGIATVNPSISFAKEVLVASESLDKIVLTGTNCIVLVKDVVQKILISYTVLRMFYEYIQSGSSYRYVDVFKESIAYLTVLEVVPNIPQIFGFIIG
jgi:hypothetical protein